MLGVSEGVPAGVSAALAAPGTGASPAPGTAVFEPSCDHPALGGHEGDTPNAQPAALGGSTASPD